MRAEDKKEKYFVGDEPLKASRPMRRVWRKQIESRMKKKVPQSTKMTEELRKPVHGSLRIVGGEARGRRLESPATMLRPMMSKVREAMFSTLVSLGVFQSDVKILDAFCGSGAIGCEALSRGAALAAFVDMSPIACEVAERNAKRCGYSDTVAACCTVEDALARPHIQGHTFDILALTPPYEEVIYADLLTSVAETRLLNPDAVVIVEYPVELGILPSTYGSQRQLVGLRNRRYGRTVLAFYVYQPTGDIPFDFKLDEFEKPKNKKK